MPTILLTNDDGIEAEGLRTLEAALGDVARLIVIAPDRERSAVSHGLTIHSPVDLKQIEPDRYVAINGTPADCIILALRLVFVEAPDLVVSGINHGANLGDDIMYSGTVAAAREAARHGIPAIAVSQAYDKQPIRFEAGAEYVRGLVASMLRNGLGGEICLNVNIPMHEIKGVKITRHGCSENMPHFNYLDSKPDFDKILQDTADSEKADLPSDHQAILDRYISLTPLQRDQTDYAVARSLMQEAARLFSKNK